MLTNSQSDTPTLKNAQNSAADWNSAVGEQSPEVLQAWLARAASELNERYADIATLGITIEARCEKARQETAKKYIEQHKSALAKINEAEAQRDAAYARVKALEESTSWRITKPLRTLSRIARRVFKGA